MFRAGLYARVSTNDQQTLAMQSRARREYADRRGWTITAQVREIGSGAAKRRAREKLLEAARRREVDRRKNGFFAITKTWGKCLISPPPKRWIWRFKG